LIAWGFRWMADMQASNTDVVSGERSQDKVPGSEPVLLLGWREFAVRFDGEFKIKEIPVEIKEESNSGKGTGLIIWDGSVLLSKYLEHAVDLKGKRILELGAGTGLVGLSCGLLGATRVFLTDLGYTLDNLNANIVINSPRFPSSDTVECFELDWTKPKDDPRLANLDLVVAADVIWIEELVKPFVDTLVFIFKRNPSLRTVIFAHQTRALKTDRLLFNTLSDNGFSFKPVPEGELHPDYKTNKLQVFKIFRTFN